MFLLLLASLASASSGPQIIFSNFNVLPVSEWLTQGYSDVAYTNAGCDDQLGPQNHLGAMVRTVNGEIDGIGESIVAFAK